MNKISDELLAAYIDGNTSSLENLFVETQLKQRCQHDGNYRYHV